MTQLMAMADVYICHNTGHCIYRQCDKGDLGWVTLIAPCTDRLLCVGFTNGKLKRLYVCALLNLPDFFNKKGNFPSQNTRACWSSAVLITLF